MTPDDSNSQCPAEKTAATVAQARSSADEPPTRILPPTTGPGPLRVRCPNPACGQPFSLPPTHQGGTLRCPHCQRPFTVAQRSSAAPLPSVAAQPPGGLAPVQQLGRFQLRARLGAGAFGTVYRAYDPQLDREVALKVPLPGTLDDPQRVERFLREARAAAQLRHPHIVPLFEAGGEPPDCYIASAYVEGRTLARALEEGALDARSKSRIMRDLAEALAYAHGLGIVHRDVKPANVLLDSRGEPHLLDFGLAHRRDAGKLTQEGALVGTPAYMAPEQVTAPADTPLPASDQYSLGVVLYELLTGQVPFEGPPEVILFNAVHTQPVPPRGRNAAVPRDLETICLKAMARRTEDRYPGCQELADDLRRWLEGEPIKARRLGLPERLWLWTRRNPLVASLVAAVAVVFLAGGITSLVFGLEADRKRTQAEAQTRRANDEKSRADTEKTRAEKEATRANAESRKALRAQAISDRTTALTLCDQGDVARGLLWLARALRAAEKAGDSELRRSLRMHLAAWRDHHHALVGVFPTSGQKASPFGVTGGLEAIGPAQPVPPHRIIRGTGSSPDGKVKWKMISQSALQLYDAAGKPLGTPLPARKPLVLSVPSGFPVFSPDGKVVLTEGETGTGAVFDVATGKRIASLANEQTLLTAYPAFSPDGKVIASSTDNQTIRLWRARTGAALGAPVYHRVYDGSPELLRFRFSLDGRYFEAAGYTKITGPYRRTSGKFWEMAPGHRLLHALEHPLSIQMAGFRDGGRLVGAVGTATDPIERVLWWETASGKPAGTPPIRWAIPVPPGGILFSPDGQTTLTRSNDSRKNTSQVCFWDATSGKPRGPARTLEGRLYQAIFSADGRVLCTYGSTGLRRWDATTGEPAGPAHSFRMSMVLLSVSPDGKMALLRRREGGHSCFLWDTTRRQRVGQPLQHRGLVGVAAISPDGRRVLTASQDGTARLWDLATGQPVGPALQHGREVTSATFSPDSRLALTGSADATARLWDAANGQTFGPPVRHSEAVKGVLFHPDGKLFLTVSERTLRLWSVPPAVEGDAVRLALWAEVSTGLELDEQGAVRVLPAPEWEQRRGRLTELAGES